MAVDIRRIVLAACDEVTPGDLHGSPDDQARFAQMTRGNYAEGFGSSCGFLVMYALWRAGLREPAIVNIDDPDYGLTYVPGKNISDVKYGSQSLGAWRTLADTPEGPSDGDCILFSNGPANTEHVAVLRTRRTIGVGGADQEHWWTADAGHPTASSSTNTVERIRSGDSLQFSDGSRKIAGWIDLGSLSFVAVPELNDPGGDSSGETPLILGAALALVVLAFFDGWLG